MAAKPRSAIIHDLEYYISSNGGVFPGWVVGVTDDPKRQLFTLHKLRAKGDAWISRRAIDDLQASEVEEYFRTVRKTAAVAGGSTMDHVYVYAYLRKAHTKP